MKKLIIFDFDGVLVDTLPVCFGINLEAHDNNLSLEEYKSFFEGNIYEAIKAGKKKPIPDFDEKYSAQTRELIIPEELKAIIKKISVNHIITIVSSTSTHLIKTILEREGVASFISDILGSDVHKNKVFKIKFLLEKYKIEPENAVFITDTVGDILEARESGIQAIAVTWGFHGEERLNKANPMTIVQTPAALLEAIENF